MLQPKTLGWLRGPSQHLLRRAAPHRSRVPLVRLGARRGRRPQLAARALRRPGPAGCVGRRSGNPRLVLLRPYRKGRARRRRLQDPRHLVLLERVEPLQVGVLGGFAPTEEGKPRDMRTFLVPCSDYQIMDNWDTIALRATGSHDVVIERGLRTRAPHPQDDRRVQVQEPRQRTERRPALPDPLRPDLRALRLYHLPRNRHRCTRLLQVGHRDKNRRIRWQPRRNKTPMRRWPVPELPPPSTSSTWCFAATST